MPNIRLPLFLTRLSIFYFLLPWQLMRFTKPESASGIAKKYYHLPGLSDSVGLIIGVFWVTLLVALPNILGLYFLAPVVKSELKSYMDDLKSGKVVNHRQKNQNALRENNAMA